MGRNCKLTLQKLPCPHYLSNNHHLTFATQTLTLPETFVHLP